MGNSGIGPRYPNYPNYPKNSPTQICLFIFAGNPAQQATSPPRPRHQPTRLLTLAPQLQDPGPRTARTQHDAPRPQCPAAAPTPQRDAQLAPRHRPAPGATGSAPVPTAPPPATERPSVQEQPCPRSSVLAPPHPRRPPVSSPLDARLRHEDALGVGPAPAAGCDRAAAPAAAGLRITTSPPDARHGDIQISGSSG